MTGSAELLPCPFDGGEAEVRSWDYPYPRWQIRCRSCGAHAKSRLKTEQQAIAAWNRRPAPSSVQEVLPVTEQVSQVVGVLEVQPDDQDSTNLNRLTSPDVEDRPTLGVLADAQALHGSSTIAQASGTCETCEGRGEIGGIIGQTAETFEWVTEPCPDCAKATGAAQ